jgi:hypothetical protein
MTEGLADAPTIEELLPAYHRALLEKFRAESRSWRLAHPELTRERRRRYRERMQRNVCGLCWRVYTSRKEHMEDVHGIKYGIRPGH